MNIEKCLDAVKNCRFCFMCRHLSAVGNVTFTEADTPRVRAVAAYGALRNPEWWSNPEYIDMFYRADLSRNCAHHCVNHYDENALVIAARTDIAERGFAPAAVTALRDELIASETWQLSGKGEVLYFVDPYTAEAKTDEVFAAIMKKAGKEYAVMRGGCIGRALKVLGFPADAKQALEKFAAEVRNTGAKTLVVSNPAAYEALKNDAAEFGVELPVTVMHTSEYLLTLNLPVAKKAGGLYYLESDYLRNYNDLPFPHELLKRLGAEEQHFGVSSRRDVDGDCGVFPGRLAGIVDGPLDGAEVALPVRTNCKFRRGRGFRLGLEVHRQCRCNVIQGSCAYGERILLAKIQGPAVRMDLNSVWKETECRIMYGPYPASPAGEGIMESVAQRILIHRCPRNQEIARGGDGGKVIQVEFVNRIPVHVGNRDLSAVD